MAFHYGLLLGSGFSSLDNRLTPILKQAMTPRQRRRQAIQSIEILTDNKGSDRDRAARFPEQILAETAKYVAVLQFQSVAAEMNL